MLRSILCAGASGFALVLSSGSPVLAQEPSKVSQTALDEVVVTGSLIPRAQRFSPTARIGQADIVASGISNAADLLVLVTANTGSEFQVDQLNQPYTSGTAQFNLRNLGLGSTLILVDGRRQTQSAVVAGDGSSFVDINSLVPLIAIDRLEVMKDGASATYGSDAVGGVVNFVLRRRVGQPEVRARYLAIDGSGEVDLQAIGGFNLAGGDLVLAGSWFQREALSGDERAFSQAQTFGRPAWHAVSSYGQPGSYFRPSTAGYAPDPDCLNPAFANSFRNSPADPFCRLDYSNYFDLSPRERRGQVYVGYDRDLAGGVALDIQAAYADTRTEIRQTPALPILAASLRVPASHPDNPFGEDVFFRGRLQGDGYEASTAQYQYRTLRLAGGLKGAFATGPLQGWRWTTDLAYSRQQVDYDKPDTIHTAFQNALRGLGGEGCNPATGSPGAGPCRYFNPFGSALLGTGTRNSEALIRSLTGSTDMQGVSSLLTAEGLMSGRLLARDRLSVDAAVGAQYRRSAFRQDWSDLVNRGELLTAGQTPDFSAHQDVAAAFAELQIGLGAVEVQLAGRHETYRDSNSRFSPKIAVLWRPIETLTLRAGYGQAFRAPSVYHQFGVQAAQPSVFDRNAFVFVNTQTFGNADLRPETSESANLGAEWRPLQGLGLSLDLYRIDYDDLIVKQSAQTLIDQARADDLAGRTCTNAQGRVRRDLTGALEYVRLDFINASSVKTSGLDLGARYAIDAWGGRLSASGAWSHVFDYDIRLAPGGAVVAGVGSANVNTLARSLPRNRGELRLGWAQDGYSVTTLAHYASGYRNDRSGVTDRSIASQTTMDLIVAAPLSPDVEATLGAINLADKDPPLAQMGRGYDANMHDPRGRIIQIGLTRRF